MSESPASRVTSITFASDYGAFPLWCYDSDDEALDFDANLISDELFHRINAWNDIFQTHYDPEQGWSSIERCRQQYRSGSEIFSALKAEVSPDITVSYEFWETAIDGVEYDLETIAKVG
ncbi:hypothetical protein [Leucobacter celer]|jgi:hypothetical protein|uniref:hypothetical protein n=1 Tax=Leucobacter celer TaxID=668625 RepID=UPI0006A76E83|nr:hypothetical protein [Leucobacter celer]